MKKISFLLLLFLGFVINGYAEDTSVKYEIFSLEKCIGFGNLSFEEQMQQLSEMWQDNWVIEVNQGLEIPLHPTLKGEIFHLEPEDNFVSVFVDKTFYLRIDDEEGILLSSDLTTWEDPEEFFTGEFDVKLLNHQDKPLINLLIELNQR